MLVLGGEGPLTAELRVLVVRSEAKVEFAGAIPEADPQNPRSPRGADTTRAAVPG